MIRLGPRRLLLGLALLDLLVFGGWITREELGRRLATEVKLPVEGYDPRDLLAGHYVQFALAAVREANRLGAEPVECGRSVKYCLDQKPDGRAHISRKRTEGDLCPLFLTAWRDPDGLLDFGVRRF